MKQLLILSGKGGTGKTTIANAFIRLASARAFADCDVDAPNLHLIFDWPKEAEKKDYFGLDKAVIDSASCSQCGLCQQHCRFNAISFNAGYIVDLFACEGCAVCEYICPDEAIKMLPAVAGELMLYRQERKVFSTAKLKMGCGTTGLLVSEVKRQMKDNLPPDAGLAIIDGSPGIGCPVIASLNGVDMVLLVAEPSLSGISDLERIVDTAAKFAVKTVVCVNKADTNPQLAKEIENFCFSYKIPFVGEIPFDPLAVTAINSGRSIIDIDCPSGRAVSTVYERTMALLLQEKIDEN